jgi:Skp family chaperone for outer membrane proteins
MNESTELVQFNELPAIAANAPAILAKNTNYVNLGIAKGNGLLDTIESLGGGANMTPELDEECNTFLLQVKGAVEKMNSGRAPITKMLTAIAKEFTRLENALDKSAEGTVPYKIQEARNELARAVAAEQRRKEQELLNKQKADKERIELVATIERKVRERYNEILYLGKKKFNDLFNTLTLDNIPDITAAVMKIPDFYPQSKFNEISVPVTSIYLPAAELPELIYDTRAALFPECSKSFSEEMTALRHNLLDMIPARVTELKEIVAAGEKEKARLQKAANLRQKEAELELEKENQRKANDALLAEQQTKEIGTAQLNFEKDVAQADIFSSGTQAVKKSYVLQIFTQVGVQMALALWFKNYAKATPLETLLKKTPAAMIKDLEKLAFNGGEMLAPSSHYEYVEDVKAVTKRG